MVYERGCDKGGQRVFLWIFRRSHVVRVLMCVGARPGRKEVSEKYHLSFCKGPQALGPAWVKCTRQRFCKILNRKNIAFNSRDFKLEVSSLGGGHMPLGLQNPKSKNTTFNMEKKPRLKKMQIKTKFLHLLSSRFSIYKV